MDVMSRAAKGPMNDSRPASALLTTVEEPKSRQIGKHLQVVESELQSYRVHTFH